MRNNTTYILAGGCDRVYPEYLRQLARVIQIDVARPKVLSCWFSNTDEESEVKFPRYKEQFLKHFNEGTEFVRAEKSTFLEQVKRADVIYFHGGQTTLLLTAMRQYGDMREAFRDKIVVGSSAGANYISRVGFSPSKGTAEFGGGLIDLSTIVHFGSKGFGELSFEPSFWHSAIGKVEEKSGTNQIILLSEGTFIVVKA